MENELNEKKKSEKLRNSALKTIIAGAIILIIIITGFIILLNKDTQINELQLETQRLDTVIQKRDSVINELDGAIGEIERNIGFIKNKREQLEFEYREGSQNKKEQIIEDIALMNTMLEESEKKMEELTRKLEASEVELSSFSNRVAKLNSELQNQTQVVSTLKQGLEERDARLTEMNEKVNELEKVLVVQTDSLNELVDSVGRSSDIIQQMDYELHKAYWVQGTFRELKENDVLDREGGFLGIGKNKTLKKDFNEEYFTELDIRETEVIPINAKKAEIISEHVDDSYKFVYQDDLIAYLKIEDPNKFWKHTKYAVIEIKQ
jgi:predicted RNase H-like nuclease (RuvC/YqgF family)